MHKYFKLIFDPIIFGWAGIFPFFVFNNISFK